MRVITFEQLLSRYSPAELREGSETSRNEMLEKYPFSVLVEGAYFETDSLEKWIQLNIGSEQINWLFYIKTGYDFGFTEFFFSDELNTARVKKIVPHIYTRFPDSDPPDRTYKTDGYDLMITYDPKDLEAVVFTQMD